MTTGDDDLPAKGLASIRTAKRPKARAGTAVHFMAPLCNRWMAQMSEMVLCGRKALSVSFWQEANTFIETRVACSDRYAMVTARSRLH